MEDYSARLVVQRQGSGYRARWVEDGGQETEPFDLALPLSEEDATELRWYLEKYFTFVGAGTRVRAQAVEARLEGWGWALFSAIFGKGKAIEHGLPTMLTVASSESAVLQQPWEMMRNDGGPLTFQGIHIRRQLEQVGGHRPTSVQLPLRVLLIISRPLDTGFIDPRSSMRPLLDGLAGLPAGAVEVISCSPPTLDRLEALIAGAAAEGHPFHVVHFDGHGNFSAARAIGYLCFETWSQATDRVLSSELGKLLARLEVPLVILEACRTSDLSDGPVVDSVAPALLAAGVGSVVAFSHSVHVEASRLLVERFYGELARGRTIAGALAAAREALRDRPQRWLHAGPKAQTVDLQDWFIPQLYQAGEDAALLAEAALPALGLRPAPADPEAHLHFFPPSPLYSFHGRAFELLQVERDFEDGPAVVVNGGGGMGKTALAREVAHWLLRLGRFEAAVFVSFEQTPSVQRVVQELGRALEGSSFASRLAEDQYEAAVALFRSRRVLLVWDNFESTLPQFQPSEEGRLLAFSLVERQELAELYRRLVQGEPAGRLLVTCRPRATGLDDIVVLPIEGLTRDDSLGLVQAIAEEQGIDLERRGYEREEVEKLLDLLGDHPLSISLVGPHLTSLKPAEICTDFAGLLDRFTDETAGEERNKSLLASLAFSTSRLSAAARAVLPWLAWFQGGAFQNQILAFSQLAPDVWLAIRDELGVTALLRVEEVPGFTNPFLRFHPTLPYATRRQEVGEVEAAEQHFVEVYQAVRREVDTALRGSAAAVGMALLAREEANFRSALEIAFRRGERQPGWQLADTLGVYLGMGARLREREVLVDWVRAQMPEGEKLDIASWAALCDQAFSLVGRGRAGEAVAMMQQLIARLETEGLAGGEGAALQLGTSYETLGQIFVNANRPDLAVEPSLKAIEILEKLPGEVAQVNHAAALGDLANAYRALGRLGEALAAAERGLAIHRQLGKEREVAGDIGRCGQILSAQQRWTETEARYQEAFELARRLGDLELQGTFLQHQGGLHKERGNPARAVELYEQAMKLFQQAGDAGSEMRTCDLLASAEQQRGQLDAAEAWYGRARELALELGDRAQLGIIAQNIGILYQSRADQIADAESRAAWLRRALQSIEESLGIHLGRNDQVFAATSYFQLGVLHQMLGDLDLAERKLREALEIFEPLDHPEIWKVYANLAKIAAAWGDAAAAAEWTAKRDAKLAELRQRRGG